jgi:hypothetical protein
MRPKTIKTKHSSTPLHDLEVQALTGAWPLVKCCLFFSVIALLCLTWPLAARAQLYTDTAVGQGAFVNNTSTALYDSAFGYDALNQNEDGSFNTATGANALRFNVSGSYNTAIGVSALQGGGPGTVTATASGNTATGFSALYAITSGSYNTAAGIEALRYNTSGNSNTAIGAKALISNQEGSYNTAAGLAALYGNTSGTYNTANGYNALYNNTTGYSNVANGQQALYSNTGGAHNVATGAEALYTNTADFNTAAGSRALYTNSTGNSNTATGYATLYNNSSGSYNTAAGTGALTNNTTGSNNIAIGRDAGANLTTGSNNIVIGTGLLAKAGEANTTRIGKTTQAKTFIGGIYNKTVASGVGVIVNSGGQLGTVQSSVRYKDDIKPMDRSSEAILKLKPVTFRYKEELDPDKIPQFGLIAEEVEKVDPDLVVRDEDGKISTVRYEAVNAMLLNEFLKERRRVQEVEKDLRATIARQQKQIENLSKRELTR